MPLPIGAELAGYRIEAVAGRGGMGVVYRAHQAALGRDVALKVIAAEHASDETFRARFIRESRLTAKLDHPNVVPVFEAGEQDGTLFIAMRWVPGEHLGDVLRRGPLEPTRAVTLVAQVAAALDAAHERGLVHRDVKPANVLLSGDHAYLADFGLARSEDSTAITTGNLLGTPAFAAPEQIEGGRVDPRSDVYALACVAYAMLAGGSPFGGRRPMEILWAHVNLPPPPLADRATGLSAGDAERAGAVLERALSKVPGERQSSAGELAADLSAALDGSGASASAPTLALGADSSPTARLPRPRRRRGAAAAALGVLAAGALALGLVAGSGDDPEQAGAAESPQAEPDVTPAPDPAAGTVRCEDSGCLQDGRRTTPPVEDATCTRVDRPGLWTRIDADGGTPLLACIADAAPATGPAPARVPDLAGARLDLAERLLERDGVPSEANGGGTFGIVERDNWTVCTTTPVPGDPLPAGAPVQLFVERSC